MTRSEPALSCSPLSMYLSQLEELKSLNGIQGLVRAEEEKSAAQRSASPQDDGSNGSSLTQYQPGSLASVGEFLQPASTSGDVLPPSLPTRPPGRQIFIHEPSLITELYPPGIESNDGGMLSDFLVHGSEEDIKNIVCGQMLPLCYLTKPCPVELQQWLFQLMARAHDSVVSSGAYRSLIGLLQSARKLDPNVPSFSAPSVANIIDVLVCLGAESEKLRPLIIQDGAAVVPAVDCEGDEVFSPPKPPSANLIHLLDYLSACLKSLPGCYTVQDLEDLVLILSSLSLDQFCSRFLESGLRHCVQLLLAAYPDSLWHKAVLRLSPQLLCLSQHHHDRLCVAYMIGRHTQRQKYLLTDFCRRCLVEMLVGRGAWGEQEGDGGGEGVGSGGGGGGEEGSCGEEDGVEMEVGDGEKASIDNDHGEGRMVSANSEQDCNHSSENIGAEPTVTQTTNTTPLHAETLALSNSAFTTRVISSFSRARLKEFKNEDYYRMHSLLLILQLCTPPSELSWSSEEKKSQYVRLLSAVCSEIRDDLNWPARAPVKELLIRMRLEVRNSSSREKQTDLFSFCS